MLERTSDVRIEHMFGETMIAYGLCEEVCKVENDC